MPLFSPQKDARVGTDGIFSIKTAADAYRWFANRKKTFGCDTPAQVLQKWSQRKQGLDRGKEALKARVKLSGIPAVTPDKQVNPVINKALAKGMQIDEQDKTLSVDVIKEMWPTSMILADFCQCLQLLVAGTKFSMGPLKGHERMAEKLADETQDGYDYEIAKLNDAYRASIVCRDQDSFDELVGLCRMLVIPLYGIAWHKPPKNKFKMPEIFLGYGDVTYFLNFREVDQTAELQIHQLGVLFGKTNLQSWGNYANIATYSSLESQYQIPGGLGHKFYEDYRNPRATPQQKEKAKALSMKYYGICRGDIAKPDDIKLFKDIAQNNRH
jgi:hypothetical protein